MPRVGILSGCTFWDRAVSRFGGRLGSAFGNRHFHCASRISMAAKGGVRQKYSLQFDEKLLDLKATGCVNTKEAEENQPVQCTHNCFAASVNSYLQNTALPCYSLQ